MHGAFRGRTAVAEGVSPKQLFTLQAHGAVERVFPDTYRLTGAPRSHDQMLRAALLWAGDGAAAASRSAGMTYGLEGVKTVVPVIAVPEEMPRRAAGVEVHRYCDRRALMIRHVRGVAVTGVEPTLLALAHELDDESLEVACEDARRRRLTSVPAMRAYLDRFARRGRPGVVSMRRLLAELDPRHPSRSTLEVKTRRLLVARGITNFAREFPLDWRGRTHRFDFAFPEATTILETNGRRWHDDPSDYEDDHEKWSVPGRHGLRLVLATWEKVTEKPDDLIQELLAAMAAHR